MYITREHVSVDSWMYNEQSHWRSLRTRCTGHREMRDLWTILISRILERDSSRILDPHERTDGRDERGRGLLLLIHVLLLGAGPIARHRGVYRSANAADPLTRHAETRRISDSWRTRSRVLRSSSTGPDCVAPTIWASLASTHPRSPCIETDDR